MRADTRTHVPANVRFQERRGATRRHVTRMLKQKKHAISKRKKAEETETKETRGEQNTFSIENDSIDQHAGEQKKALRLTQYLLTFAVLAKAQTKSM